MTDPCKAAIRWCHRRFHVDDRGNLGILLLMTIWALVLLIAMVWNTGELATRRRHVQAAADSAAHASNQWVSRTTNLTASSNLVMSQNASAEVMLRSVTPTRNDIQKRFDGERRRAIQLRDGDRKSEPEEGIPDCEYFEELLGFGSWSGKGRGQERKKELTALTPDVLRALDMVLPLLQAQQAQRLSQDMNTALQQNRFILDWLLDTYIGPVGGASGTPAPVPSPSSFTPVGAPVSDWITNQVRPRLEDILATLDVEQSWLDKWVAQTAPALSTTPEELRQVRFEIFDYQNQIRDLTPAVVEEQRNALATMYKVETSASVPGRLSEGEPTPVTAPVTTSASVGGETVQDSIRQRYPGATARRWGSPSPEVYVDPINVNVDHSAIWHPGSGSSVDGVVLENATYSGSVSVGGGDWGRIPCAPLNRYVNDRVYRDREGLRTEPRAIDGVRSDLRGRVHPPPSPPTISPLPNQVDEPTTTTPPPNPAPRVSLPPRQIPSLPLPQELTQANRDAITAVNDRIREYNRELRDFVSDLRRLENAVARMHDHLHSLTDVSSQRFADATWLGHVDRNRDLVLRLMGSDKHFMVLATYQLHHIPDWAIDGMRADVQRHVYNLIYSRSINPVTRRLQQEIYQWALGVLGGSLPQGTPRSTINNRARQFAQQAAPPAAQNAVRRAAETVSREVAAEWIRRPWPYEIAPPTEEVPPARGLSDDERKKHFTSLAAALTTDQSSARTLLAKYFKTDSGPMVAFAQSEIFNWMEFQEGYGASDRYDRITFYGHGDMGGSPRPWRLGSPGGWNWEPRLAHSDALAQAIADGEHFRGLFEKGGVNANGNSDSDSIQTLATH
ncbi:pilus assembly protein TadG-related protein [Humisphaera borealis]|uniref:Putative Flp pilus-assembly TadG-like N-terminal domain-containing protein n=1 Tax=Humisphaera borealis TaxID=2807512 RepID=A0A7M2WV84_9BACT|nr:pilus assembly protein TadG-related protein [Humisphaera borealis]QOV88400.1 hypothetical protein IPV69_19405 [Humisphaera borealis]